MEQGTDFDRITRTTRRREFDDGLIDIAVGAYFLLGSVFLGFFSSHKGLSWFANALTSNRALFLSGLAVFYLTVLAVPLCARIAIDHIRRSRIWRESGVTKPLRIAAGWPTILLSVVILLSMIVGAYILLQTDRIEIAGAFRILIASVGIGSGILYYSLGHSLGLRRYLAVGMGGGILSLAILFIPVSISAAWLILGFSWSIALAISGLSALRQTLSAVAENSHD